MPDVTLVSRHPALIAVPTAKWSAAAGTIFTRRRSSYRHCQVRCPYTRIRVNSSARNLPIIIYVLSAFQMSSIAAFEVVEVGGCVGVVPDNCAAIHEVCVAGDTDYLPSFINTVGFAVDVLWRTTRQRFEMPDAI